MKVLIILGSPKRNGNTAKVVDILEKNLALLGHETERIQVADFEINGCLGCNACFSKKDQPNCVQKDDAMSIFNRMMSADVIVYASPLYAFSFPAQLKSFIDRHYCFVTNGGLSEQSSVIEGKRVALLITCSDPQEKNADLIPIIFDRIFLRLNCLVSGKYIVESSSAPDFELRARKISQTIANEITK